MVEITSPTDDQVAGPDGVTLTFTLSAGATLTGCTVDGDPVADCESGATLAPAGGSHVVEVTAMNADGDTGSDMAPFLIDAAPPVIESIADQQLELGSTELSFTLTDATSAIASIHCRLDGGAFEACGTGTTGSAAYTDLTPGAHLFEIYAVDEWGNSGEAAVSLPVAAPFARHPLTVTTGPGHLILIGNDYADRPGDPDATQAQLLVNTLWQSAAKASETRGVRVLAVRAPDAYVDQTEIDNIEAILTPEVETGGYHEIDDASAIPGALPGVDVLLIYDHNGADVQSLAATLEPTLRAFLEAGGVVVVTDGLDLAGDPVPSQTYRIIDPTLLQIHAAVEVDALLETRFNCISGRPSWLIPCNDADPLAAQGTARALPVRICTGNWVGYESPEPWVTYATLSFADELEADHPGVFHKWFGTVDPAVGGPVAVTMKPEPDYFPSEETAIFQDASGGLLHVCSEDYAQLRGSDPAPMVLQNGTAVFHMVGGGHASRGVNSYDEHYDWGNGYLLTTWVGVQPLEDLHFQFQPLRDGDGFDPPNATVVLPNDAADVAYSVYSGCGGAQSSLAQGSVSVRTCGHGTYSLIVEALDCAGYNAFGRCISGTDQVLKYAILNGVTEHDGDDVVLPAYATWNVPNLDITVDVGTLTDVTAVDFSVTQSVGALHYREGYQTYFGDVSADPSFTFYSSAGSGTPAMNQLAHAVGLRYAEECKGPQMDFHCYRQRSERAAGGALSSLTSGTIAADALTWLPLLDVDTLPELDPATGAMSAEFTLAAPLGSDVHGGKLVILTGFDKKWTIIFPVEGTSGTTSVTSAPPPPDWFPDPQTGPGYCETVPLGCDFWPVLQLQDVPYVGRIDLIEASDVSSYGDLRRQAVYDDPMRGPSAGTFSRRTTSLIYTGDESE